MSNSTNPRHKNVPGSESLIRRVLRDAPSQLPGNCIIVNGRDVLVAGRDIHITIRMVIEAPYGPGPHPAGKPVRADSRRSKRVSR